MERGQFCELHQRRIIQDEDFGIAYIMRFRMAVIFFLADPEPGGAQQDTEIARIRKKITSLKSRLKDIEWKFRIVVVLGIVGWIGFLFLLLQNSYKLRQTIWNAPKL
ncbi:uncharacterized protein DS421_14g470890 [Arachis hypogaea]|nr:uncharacterized protein DS421_14g470890 [Arachis hypogaea]